jgi:hypothetical protein
MARKASRKSAPRAASTAAADTLPLTPLVPAVKHELHILNVTKSAANWSLTGGGQKHRGVTPPSGESTIRVEHAKKYKITFWGKDKQKKESANLGPDGSAIYNGRGVAVTHPH